MNLIISNSGNCLPGPKFTTVSGESDHLAAFYCAECREFNPHVSDTVFLKLMVLGLFMSVSYIHM